MGGAEGAEDGGGGDEVPAGGAGEQWGEEEGCEVVVGEKVGVEDAVGWVSDRFSGGTGAGDGTKARGPCIKAGRKT